MSSSRTVYYARFTAGWGSALHDFLLYVPENRVDREYIMDLRSAYVQLMDRYTPVALRRIKTGAEVSRLYISADMFPHMPYRALRELEHDYRKGELTKEVYEQGKEIFTRATQYGLPLPYFIYFYRNNYPGFTIPLQLHPTNGKIYAYSTTPLEMVEADSRRTVERTLRIFVRTTVKLLAHTRIMGYVPKVLLENRFLLYNLFVLYAYTLPMEMLRHTEAAERMLEIAIGRGYARWLPGFSGPVVDYYRRSILPYAITTVEENLEYPGIAAFDPYGPYARAALILNLTTSSFRREGMQDMVNPFAITRDFLLDKRKTLHDVLMVSIRDEIIPYMPDNTFSFGSLLYTGLEKFVNVQTKVEAESILSESNVNASYAASVRRRITEFLLSQVFPVLSARDEIHSIRDTYARYQDILGGTTVWKVLSTDTEYVDDRLLNLLTAPTSSEIQNGQLEN